MQSKKVGVVIPIYNVEKYLKECLESVICQTYKNLSIVLVNDGSKDTSFELCKEYALKDERIIIINKENGGLSSARNAGIELFSNQYKLDINKTLSQGEFNIFEITNENTLNIKQILSSKSARSLSVGNFMIDYLIFLDSDNFWQLNCVDECVKKMQGVQVLCFDHKEIYDDGIVDKKRLTRMQLFYQNECIITPKEYAQRALEIGSKDISYSWGGMIDFHFLKQIKLKFINKIINEDIAFGMSLFAQASFIYILPKKLYVCRLRANSISNHDKKISADNIAPYFRDLFIEFDENAKEAKHYLKAASRVITALALIEFFKNIKENENNQAIKKVFLNFYLQKAKMITKCHKDPWKLKAKFELIKPYIKFQVPYEIVKIYYKIKAKLSPSSQPYRS